MNVSEYCEKSRQTKRLHDIDVDVTEKILLICKYK